MANMLMPGAGGLPSPSPGDDKPVAAAPGPNHIAMKAKPRGQSRMMGHYGAHADATEFRFDKMKEAETQINATVDEMTQLNTMGDTVTAKDVVKHFSGLVAAGIPAVAVATILAEMPEQPQQLQSWVQEKYQHAVAGKQKVDQLLTQARHQMVSASLNHLIAHSAEAHAMSQPAQGNA